jgi:hypothetical protein
METKLCRSCPHHIKGWAGLVYWVVGNPLLQNVPRLYVLWFQCTRISTTLHSLSKRNKTKKIRKSNMDELQCKQYKSINRLHKTFSHCRPIHCMMSVSTQAKVHTRQTSAETGCYRNITILPHKQYTVYIPPQPPIENQWVYGILSPSN